MDQENKDLEISKDVEMDAQDTSLQDGNVAKSQENQQLSSQTITVENSQKTQNELHQSSQQERLKCQQLQNTIFCEEFQNVGKKEIGYSDKELNIRKTNVQQVIDYQKQKGLQRYQELDREVNNEQQMQQVQAQIQQDIENSENDSGSQQYISSDVSNCSDDLEIKKKSVLEKLKKIQEGVQIKDPLPIYLNRQITKMKMQRSELKTFVFNSDVLRKFRDSLQQIDQELYDQANKNTVQFKSTNSYNIDKGVLKKIRLYETIIQRKNKIDKKGRPIYKPKEYGCICKLCGYYYLSSIAKIHKSRCVKKLKNFIEMCWDEEQAQRLIRWCHSEFELHKDDLNWDGNTKQGFIIPYCSNLYKFFENPIDFFIGIWQPIKWKEGHIFRELEKSQDVKDPEQQINTIQQKLASKYSNKKKTVFQKDKLNSEYQTYLNSNLMSGQNDTTMEQFLALNRQKGDLFIPFLGFNLCLCNYNGTLTDVNSALILLRSLQDKPPNRSSYSPTQRVLRQLKNSDPFFEVTEDKTNNENNDGGNNLIIYKSYKNIPPEYMECLANAAEIFQTIKVVGNYLDHSSLDEVSSGEYEQSKCQAANIINQYDMNDNLIRMIKRHVNFHKRQYKYACNSTQQRILRSNALYNKPKKNNLMKDLDQDVNEAREQKNKYRDKDQQIDINEFSAQVRKPNKTEQQNKLSVLTGERNKLDQRQNRKDDKKQSSEDSDLEYCQRCRKRFQICTCRTFDEKYDGQVCPTCHHILFYCYCTNFQKRYRSDLFKQIMIPKKKSSKNQRKRQNYRYNQVSVKEKKIIYNGLLDDYKKKFDVAQQIRSASKNRSSDEEIDWISTEQSVDAELYQEDEKMMLYEEEKARQKKFMRQQIKDQQKRSQQNKQKYQKYNKTNEKRIKKHKERYAKNREDSSMEISERSKAEADQPMKSKSSSSNKTFRKSESNSSQMSKASAEFNNSRLTYLSGSSSISQRSNREDQEDYLKDLDVPLDDASELLMKKKAIETSINDDAKNLPLNVRILSMANDQIFQRVINKLKAHGKKKNVDHYLWYVFMTDRMGTNDKLKTQLADDIERDIWLQNHPKSWRKMLMQFAELMQKNQRSNVIPLNDVGRVNKFIEQWKKYLRETENRTPRWFGKTLEEIENYMKTNGLHQMDRNSLQNKSNFKNQYKLDWKEDAQQFLDQFIMQQDPRNQKQSNLVKRIHSSEEGDEEGGLMTPSKKQKINDQSDYNDDQQFQKNQKEVSQGIKPSKQTDQKDNNIQYINSKVKNDEDNKQENQVALEQFSYDQIFSEDVGIQYIDSNGQLQQVNQYQINIGQLMLSYNEDVELTVGRITNQYPYPQIFNQMFKELICNRATDYQFFNALLMKLFPGEKNQVRFRNNGKFIFLDNIKLQQILENREEIDSMNQQQREVLLKNVFQENVPTNSDIVFIPLFNNGNHWNLVVCYQDQFYVFDSHQILRKSKSSLGEVLDRVNIYNKLTTGQYLSQQQQTVIGRDNYVQIPNQDRNLNLCAFHCVLIAIIIKEKVIEQFEKNGQAQDIKIGRLDYKTATKYEALKLKDWLIKLILKNSAFNNAVFWNQIKREPHKGSSENKQNDKKDQLEEKDNFEVPDQSSDSSSQNDSSDQKKYKLISNQFEKVNQNTPFIEDDLLKFLTGNYEIYLKQDNLNKEIQKRVLESTVKYIEVNIRQVHSSYKQLQYQKGCEQEELGERRLLDDNANLEIFFRVAEYDSNKQLIYFCDLGQNVLTKSSSYQIAFIYEQIMQERILQKQEKECFYGEEKIFRSTTDWEIEFQKFQAAHPKVDETIVQNIKKFPKLIQRLTEYRQQFKDGKNYQEFQKKLLEKQDCQQITQSHTQLIDNHQDTQKINSQNNVINSSNDVIGRVQQECKQHLESMIQTIKEGKEDVDQQQEEEDNDEIQVADLKNLEFDQYERVINSMNIYLEKMKLTYNQENIKIELSHLQQALGCDLKRKPSQKRILSAKQSQAAYLKIQEATNCSFMFPEDLNILLEKMIMLFSKWISKARSQNNEIRKLQRKAKDQPDSKEGWLERQKLLYQVVYHRRIRDHDYKPNLKGTSTDAQIDQELQIIIDWKPKTKLKKLKDESDIVALVRHVFESLYISRKIGQYPEKMYIDTISFLLDDFMNEQPEFVTKLINNYYMLCEPAESAKAKEIQGLIDQMLAVQPDINNPPQLSKLPKLSLETLQVLWKNVVGSFQELSAEDENRHQCIICKINIEQIDGDYNLGEAIPTYLDLRFVYIDGRFKVVHYTCIKKENLRSKKGSDAQYQDKNTGLLHLVRPENSLNIIQNMKMKIMLQLIRFKEEIDFEIVEPSSIEEKYDQRKLQNNKNKKITQLLKYKLVSKIDEVLGKKISEQLDSLDVGMCVVDKERKEYRERLITQVMDTLHNFQNALNCDDVLLKKMAIEHIEMTKLDLPSCLFQLAQANNKIFKQLPLPQLALTIDDKVDVQNFYCKLCNNVRNFRVNMDKQITSFTVNKEECWDCIWSKQNRQPIFNIFDEQVWSQSQEENVQEQQNNSKFRFHQTNQILVDVGVQKQKNELLNQQLMDYANQNEDQNLAGDANMQADNQVENIDAPGDQEMDHNDQNNNGKDVSREEGQFSGALDNVDEQMNNQNAEGNRDNQQDDQTMQEDDSHDQVQGQTGLRPGDAYYQDVLK